MRRPQQNVLIGATGSVCGRLVTTQLVAGRDVRVLARSPQRAERVTASGAASVAG